MSCFLFFICYHIFISLLKMINIKIDKDNEFDPMSLLKTSQRFNAIIKKINVDEEDTWINFLSYSNKHNCLKIEQGLKTIYGEHTHCANFGGWYFDVWKMKMDDVDFAINYCDELGCTIEYITPINKENFDKCKSIMEEITNVISCETKEDLTRLFLDESIKSGGKKGLKI